MSTKEALLAQVNDVLKGTGYVATDVGPSSVGVQGDARVYSPSIVVDFGFENKPNWDDVSKAATDVINRVPGVARVLMDITTR